jgi:hypothetical protein
VPNMFTPTRMSHWQHAQHQHHGMCARTTFGKRHQTQQPGGISGVRLLGAPPVISRVISTGRRLTVWVQVPDQVVSVCDDRPKRADRLIHFH